LVYSRFLIKIVLSYTKKKKNILFNFGLFTFFDQNCFILHKKKMNILFIFGLFTFFNQNCFNLWFSWDLD